MTSQTGRSGSGPGAPRASRGGDHGVLWGVIAIAAALIVGAGAGLAVFWPRDDDTVPTPTPSPAPPVVSDPLGIAAVEYATPLPSPTPHPTLPPVRWEQPTADPAAIAAALDTPVLTAFDDGTIARQDDPLTIIPARARDGIVTYSVKKDDNLRSIAETFGLQENTIIWSNNRFYVNAMRVGLELTILPVDGVYHRVDDPQTIAEVAQEYDVDPYAIIDSEYNNLFGAQPDSLLSEGLYVVVPGGTGSTEPIYWNPGIVMTTASNSGAVGTGVRAGTDYAEFAVGDPGSCGRQPVSGGSAPTGAPIWSRYTISQNFSWNHGGIDLAVPAGTPVYAAGGGTVIFSGWSTWGYGYTVVVAHGGSLSIYGHLNGAFVSCGQVVTRGQNIAVTGNSGHSSGPHLHFEIRGPGGSPVNPWDYQSF